MEFFLSELYPVKFRYKWIQHGTQESGYLASVPSDFPSGLGQEYHEDGFEQLAKWSTVETVEEAGFTMFCEPLLKNTIIFY